MKRNTSLWTQDEAARMSPAGWMALGIGVLVVVAVGSVPAPEILRAEPAPDLFQSLPNRFPLVPYNLLRHSAAFSGFPQFWYSSTIFFPACSRLNRLAAGIVPSRSVIPW